MEEKKRHELNGRLEVFDSLILEKAKLRIANDVAVSALKRISSLYSWSGTAKKQEWEEYRNGYASNQTMQIVKHALEEIEKIK